MGKIKKDQKQLKSYPENKDERSAVSDTFAAYQPLYTDDIALFMQAKQGLAPKAAFDFIAVSGFSYQDFQQTFNTTVKTIQNYASQGTKLDATLSEKLLKCFALYTKGSEVFGSTSAFTEWLNTSAYGLGNQIPYHLLDTITGIGLVEEELIRIAYGDLA